MEHNYVFCFVNMFDAYQRVAFYDAEKKYTTFQKVVEMSELPQAIVEVCQTNLTTEVRLSGGYPDWDCLINDIHRYCKTNHSFANGELNIQIV
jgi:hypothetical protein